MAIDYSDGKYVLYGQLPEKPRVGWADNGFVYSDIGTWQFRLDGEEIYSAVGSELVGWIELGIASTKDGKFLFIIEADA